MKEQDTKNDGISFFRLLNKYCKDLDFIIWVVNRSLKLGIDLSDAFGQYSFTDLEAIDNCRDRFILLDDAYKDEQYSIDPGKLKNVSYQVHEIERNFNELDRLIDEQKHYRVRFHRFLMRGPKEDFEIVKSWFGLSGSKLSVAETDNKEKPKRGGNNYDGKSFKCVKLEKHDIESLYDEMNGKFISDKTTIHQFRNAFDHQEYKHEKIVWIDDNVKCHYFINQLVAHNLVRKRHKWETATSIFVDNYGNDFKSLRRAKSESTKSSYPDIDDLLSYYINK